MRPQCPGSLVPLLLLFISFCTVSCTQNSSSDSRIIKKKTHPATDFLGAAAHELRMLRDPSTRQIPKGIRRMELFQAEGIQSAQSITNQPMVSSYFFAGPNNLGGRTRSVVYDSRYNGTSNRILLAGGISGGLFKSVDDGATWVRKSPKNALYSVTSIAQVPGTDTWYYSTGEAIGNSTSGAGAFYFGDGVFRSTDNGETWSKLANSNAGVLETFDARQDLITKISVNPVNGHVYMAVLDAIYRSTNGGTSWSNVLTSGSLGLTTGKVTDVIITPTGRVYAGFSGTTNTGPTNNLPGVWTSSSGDLNDWNKIAGDSSLINPPLWNANGAYGRVVLAYAPSDETQVYALYYNNVECDCTPEEAEAEFYKWTFTGPNDLDGTWTNLTAQLPDDGPCLAGNNPFAVQGGYDLVVAVQPNNPNIVYIGGTNLYRSTDAFSTTANTTRIGGYASAANFAPYANSHADIHAMVFKPGDPVNMICANDGGIQRTSNNLAATVVWSPINVGYNTFQYYSVAIDPRAGNNKIIGGAQDNGTTRNISGTGVNFEQVLSGDGVTVGLSNVVSGSTYEYCGFQNGQIFRRNSISLPNFATAIKPSSTDESGLFVTLFHLDQDNTSNSIYYVNSDTLYRNTSANTATSSNWTKMTGITEATGANLFYTALATTRGAYSASTSSLFIGAEDGTLLRLDDPQNAAAAATPVDITGASFPVAYLSSIAVNPRNDDTIMVTFSNYNTTSIWWTGNANSGTPTWVNVERNLTVPSVRSSAIVATANGVQYFVGTSVGLFMTPNGNTTDWVQEGPVSLGNAVVSSLAVRTADNTLLVGTHGYGMWTASVFALPVTFTTFSGKVDNKSNVLDWVTQDEINNKGFELERKYPDENVFRSVAFIKGSNQNGRNSYQYTDRSFDLAKPNISYRLKQSDFDGRIKYSQVITLSRKASLKFVEYISSNQNNLLIRLNDNRAYETLLVSFYDLSGKLISRSSVPSESQAMDITRLPAATYVVELIRSDGSRHSEKFLKQ